jgi:hypothetical protein
MSTFPPPIASAPQSWYRGCELESLTDQSYHPDYTATCPSGFSQNSTWANPDPLLTMPSLAPNSAALTNVATAAINGGTDGTGAVAASPGTLTPGQTIGPATLTGPTPSIIPPYWNSPAPAPPSIAQELGAWACEHPALAALAVGGVFLMFSRGGKR